MADSKTGTDPEIVPIEGTLLRIVVVFRIIGAAWLLFLAVAVLMTEEPRIDSAVRLGLVVSVMAVAVVGAAVTFILARRNPVVLCQPWFQAIDVLASIWVAVTPSLVRSDGFFAGGYPISSAFLIATTRGMGATLAVAVVIAASSVVGVRYASARAAEVVFINLLAPLVVAWGFGTIREHDRQRREAEEALAEERAKRARADERAEMAAHLHDSVLQTLALIQRRVPENRDVVVLARRQERALRAWLNGGSPLGADNLLTSALARVADQIESEHDVLVELSVAGDTTLDDRLEGVVLAAREAIGNAARFSGADRVYVLAEVDAERIRVVVRDRGRGFDPEAIPEGRRGVRESIVGRMERLGGKATIHSQPGRGTEVDLMVER